MTKAEPDFLDDIPFSLFQLRSLLLAGSTLLLDGIDNQVLGFAAPALIHDWAVSREALGNVFALGFAGMAGGTLIAGWLGDRIGRRGTLLGGVLLFALATLLTGFTNSLVEIAVLRTIAGLGLGGVPGTAATLIAEYTPSRHRAVAVTGGIISIAVGGILGGLMASAVLPTLGWRWLFYVGGSLPIVSIVLVYAMLPESPRFLAGRAERHDELRRLLARMNYHGPLPTPAAHATEPAAFVPTTALFGPEFRRDTLCLSAALFVGLILIYLMFNWAPTLFYASGFALGATSSGLTCFNLGGSVGAVIGGILMARFGSRRVLLVLGIGGTLLSAGLATLPIAGGRNLLPLLLALFLLGTTGSAVQSAIYAVASHAFPTSLRARGIGFMASAGRVGALISAFAGAFLTRNSWAFFGALAIVLALNTLFLAGVRRHIPASSRVDDVGLSGASDGWVV